MDGAWSILAPVADPVDRTGFVGRAAELEVVGRAVADARAGSPSLLLVGGEAGIGKSSLVRWGAELAGVDRHLGRCVHLGGEVIPLAPVADLLRQVRRAAPGPWGDSPTLVALLDGASPGAGAGAGGLEPGGAFGAVLDLVARLGADRTALVGFEDLHWADPMTWNLLEFLARNLIDEHVVLVGTYRADAVWSDPVLGRRLAELARLDGVHRLQLTGLDRAEVDEAVTGLLGVPAPAALVDDVLARGQGNPFFTAELVAAQVAGEAIPAGLADLLSTEVAELDERTRTLLGALAAIGRDVDHDLLREAAGLDEDALEKALRTARDARVVEVDPDTAAYRFRHALIGEVVYRDLLAPQRRRIHRRVADVLLGRPASASGPGGGADEAAELAFHLDRAGDGPAAFTALLAAADAAQAVAPRTALGHLERALELWDEAGEAAAGTARGDRLWQAAELASGTVGNQRAVELATTALQFGAPPLGEAWGHERLGRYLWTSGRLDESAVEFERAAALVAAAPSGPGVAATLAGLGQADLMRCRFEAADRWCRQLFDLVPEASLDPAAWTMGRRVLGVALAALGRPEEAVARCREAVEAAPTAQARALARIYLASVLVDVGACPEAVECAVAGVAEVDRAGIDRSTAGYLDAVAAEALLRLGRWDEAGGLLARHPEPDDLPVGELRLGRARALLAAGLGDRPRAEAALADLGAQPVDAWHQPLVDAAVAEVHLVLGDAEAAATQAAAGARSSGGATAVWAPRFALLRALSGVEHALDAQARQEPVDVPAVVAGLREAIDDAAATGRRADGAPPTPDAVARLALARASLTRLTGPDPEAWAAAADLAEGAHDAWLAATARLREAEATVSTGDLARAAAALQEAQARAAALGSPPLLDAIAAVARRSRLSVEAPPAVVLAKGTADGLGLTAREAEVLARLAAGDTNRQIGEALYISEKTASVHVSNILRKLGVTSRVDAAAIAQRLGGP